MLSPELNLLQQVMLLFAAVQVVAVASLLVMMRRAKSAADGMPPGYWLKAAGVTVVFYLLLQWLVPKLTPADNLTTVVGSIFFLSMLGQFLSLRVLRRQG